MNPARDAPQTPVSRECPVWRLWITQGIVVGPALRACMGMELTAMTLMRWANLQSFHSS